MKLLYQTHSPFARKALVFAHELGVADQLEVVHCETSPTNRNDDVFALNPLGKVPVLITNDGTKLFDSGVICAYLNEQHAQAELIPSDPVKRYVSLCLEALADGLSEAEIWARWESVRRPEHLRHPAFLDGQLMKLAEGYDFIERSVPLADQVSIGEIALATSLSWLEFRDLPSFRTGHARLAEWFDKFSERPSMKATVLSVDTHD